MAKKAKIKVEEMTAEQKAIHDVVKAKKAKKKAEKRANLVTVLQFAIEYGEEDIKKLARALLPREAGGVVQYVGGVRKNLIVALFDQLFPLGVGSTIDENAVWEAVKLGRAEMRKKAPLAIKKAEPAERRWVHLNAGTGIYTLQGIGATPPDGWLGFVPIDVEA